MKKILLRASRSPFDGVSNGSIPKEYMQAVYEQLSRPGTRNAGNLMFAHAMHKILSVAGAEVDIDAYRLTLDDKYRRCAGYINERYDSFVIPLCNSFRNDYGESLERMTRTLREIKIPCIVAGVGAQLSLSRDFSELGGVRDQVKRFISCILDRSESVGVRGGVTKAYLVHLGFPADRIDVIGCPSMFYYGGDFNVVKRGFGGLALNYNITGIKDRRILPFLSCFTDFSGDLKYVPQVRRLMHEAAKGRFSGEGDGVSLGVPIASAIRLERMAYFFDVPPWIDFMRSRSFAIGTRIHGNIVALLAGTPAHVIVHDSRTLELARYFGIPHTNIDALEGFDLQRTYELSDYSALNEGHLGRMGVFAGFLQRNGLEHGLYNSVGMRLYDEGVRRSYSLIASPKVSSCFVRKLRRVAIQLGLADYI